MAKALVATRMTVKVVVLLYSVGAYVGREAFIIAYDYY
jgi:hypothetical protein